MKHYFDVNDGSGIIGIIKMIIMKYEYGNDDVIVGMLSMI